MKIRNKRADLMVLPALCGLAISLYAAGYIGGKFIEFRSLRIQAEAIVDSVRDYIHGRIGPGLNIPGPDGQGTVLRTIEIPGSDSLPADLRSVLVLDDRGRIAAPGRSPTRDPFEFNSAIDRATFERAIRTGITQYNRVAPERPGEFRTVFYAPLFSIDKLIGVIRLDVDQTADALLLSSAMQSRRLMTRLFGIVGVVITLLMFWRYIKERWTAEEEIRFLAMHDVLTKLANRAQFKLRLERALERAFRTGTKIAVIGIDVDNFKDINDTLGHPVGDRILKATAERILSVSGPKATVARLSGDEFAVLIEDYENETALRKAANRFLRSASIAHEIDGNEVVTSISIGIALAPADGSTVEGLMKNADLALYRAKADGRNTIRFFTSDLDLELRRKRLVEDELRRDLGSDRFDVYYQPQYDLRSGALVGYEALARWTNPKLGVVSPTVFIPAAESCGLITPLCEWLLLNACKTAKEWPVATKLAVNISAAQFRAGDVADIIERGLRWSGLAPDRLEIEITETVLLRTTDIALATLNRLRALGVSIALDDFGTGYSSLSYLSRFPIDKIKIDRSFIQQLAEERKTAAIVKAIIDLGEALQLEIIAEGVETPDQAALLRTMGCHQAQGYLFGVPKPTTDIPVPEIIRQQDALRKAAI